MIDYLQQVDSISDRLMSDSEQPMSRDRRGAEQSATWLRQGACADRAALQDATRRDVALRTSSAARSCHPASRIDPMRGLSRHSPRGFCVR